jgi:LPPG:FO 2-phospho-L-lactate transferase
MKVVAFAGGVGGAKLADGLAKILPADQLTIIVNCGDDFDMMGLRICPDLDTICYTLSGLANPTTGWGQRDETWVAYEQIIRLGGPDWFRLGDRDLATHLERTRRLQSGQPLSEVTADFSKTWGISPRVLPMTDEPMQTWVNTVEAGWIPFQEYFVKLAFQPVIKEFEFRGIENARPAPGVIDAILNANCLIVCPSNPWVSIGPILAVEGIQDAILHCPIRLVMSPIIGGKALKGPAAKMYAELGIEPSALAVARQYQEWCTDFVVDQVDRDLSAAIEMLGMSVIVMNTVMASPDDRVRVARELLVDYLAIQPMDLA